MARGKVLRARRTTRLCIQTGYWLHCCSRRPGPCVSSRTESLIWRKNEQNDKKNNFFFSKLNSHPKKKNKSLYVVWAFRESITVSGTMSGNKVFTKHWKVKKVPLSIFFLKLVNLPLLLCLPPCVFLTVSMVRVDRLQRSDKSCLRLQFFNWVIPVSRALCLALPVVLCAPVKHLCSSVPHN